MDARFKFRQAQRFLFAGMMVSLLMLSPFGCGGGGGNGGGSSASGTLGSLVASPPVTPLPSPKTLSWDAPTTYTDGTALSDLAGYKIYIGASPGNYTKSVDVGNVTTCTIDSLSLAPGTYYFAATAYDAEGKESVFSNEVSKTIQ
ncbi:MAG TPA: fibronectin type III domain-containing protein [Dissulfurispiraceae bacterium]